MRIAILPVTDRHGGGIYQYSSLLLTALEEIAGDRSGFELVVIGSERALGAALPPTAASWRFVPFSDPDAGGLTRVRRLVGEGPHREVWRALRRGWSRRGAPGAPASALDPIRPRTEIERWWRRQGIDLVVYPQPNALAFEVGIPFVVAVHDLQHRLQPEFPEVSAGGEWGRREYVVRNCLARATSVLVDSELGEEQVVLFYGGYGVTEERVKILPYLPAGTLKHDMPETALAAIRRAYSLPAGYIFYPAQFWPHKNHARIVMALEALKASRGLRVPAVFCGSHSDPIREANHRLLTTMANDCGVSDQISILGYVPDEHMAALYAGARALVMPTFFGPTNIPVLEAWALGCPVLTSDIPGIREQAGDAALLVDPRSVEAIADGIFRLWTDAGLRGDLAERGRRRLAAYTPAEFRRRLREILADAAARLGPARVSPPTG